MNETFKNYFNEKKAEMAVISAVLGVGSVLLNYVITSNLLPFAYRQDSFDRRVSAVENSLANRPEMMQRFVLTEQEVKDMKDDVKEIKTDVKAILEKR